MTWKPCEDCDRPKMCSELLVLRSREVPMLDGRNMPYCYKLYKEQLAELAVMGRVVVDIRAEKVVSYGAPPEGPTPCDQIAKKVRPEKN